jgi:hypothetical protein
MFPNAVYASDSAPGGAGGAFGMLLFVVIGIWL